MEYPDSYKMLRAKERLFVDCYLSESLVEPQTNKHTFNDKFLSYVFAFNKSVGECLRVEYHKLNYATKEIERLDRYIEGCDVTVTIINAKLYMSMVKNSTRIYNKCNRAINEIRMQSYDGQDNSRVLELKDAIYNSAIHSDDTRDRNENRKMAMKMFGLDQVRVDMGLDIYEASGKNILKARKEDFKDNNDDAPIIPDVLEDDYDTN